jgi:ribosomal protein S18 acetylase RimI-like enzyme
VGSAIRDRRIEPRGLFLKMALTSAPEPTPDTDPDTIPLSPADRDEVDRFYARAYPGHWFDPRMLETGQMVGIRIDGRLASVAGVHVYSSEQRVAALGNVATDPEFRGQGLARRASSALLSGLAPNVDHIGLNVHSENQAAIALYEGLGFEVVARYEEVMVEPA